MAQRVKSLQDMTANRKRDFLIQVFDDFLKPLSDVFDKHAESVAPLLQKAKLWYFPSIPIDIGNNLLKLTEQGADISIGQVEQVFIDYYDKNNCEKLQEMVRSWFDTSTFDKRKHIIEDALNAHITGKYTLSIPALLPQVEGTLSEITKTPAGSLGRLLESAVKFDYLDDAITINALADDILLALAVDPFLFNRERFGDFFTSEKYREWMNSHGIETIPLNRNTILHGIQTDYGTKANSLRVFFLLDSIYWIVSERMKVILNKV